MSTAIALIVDDEPDIRELLEITLGRMKLRTVSAGDLATAKAYISVLGTDEERRGALEALSTAAPFFRRELRSRLVIKRVPDLEFEYDDTIERGSHILSLINQVNRERDLQNAPD